MTSEQFKQTLESKLLQEYPDAKIKISLIQRSIYEEQYSQSFHVPAAINFLQPVAIIKIHQNKDKKFFLAFIDKRGQGHICPEDPEKNQKKSPIARFETKA